METSRRLLRDLAARDWEGLASVFAPDLVLEDALALRCGSELPPGAKFCLECPRSTDDRHIRASLVGR